MVQIIAACSRREQLLAAGARAEHVDGREDALLRQLAVEAQLHVAGALELLVDHVVHARAGLDQAGGDDRQAAAFLDVAGGAEEALGRVEGDRVHAAGERLARCGHGEVIGARQAGDRVQQDDDVAARSRPAAWRAPGTSPPPGCGSRSARRRSTRTPRPSRTDSCP